MSLSRSTKRMFSRSKTRKALKYAYRVGNRDVVKAIKSIRLPKPYRSTRRAAVAKAFFRSFVPGGKKANARIAKQEAAKGLGWLLVGKNAVLGVGGGVTVGMRALGSAAAPAGMTGIVTAKTLAAGMTDPMMRNYARYSGTVRGQKYGRRAQIGLATLLPTAVAVRKMSKQKRRFGKGRSRG